MNDRSDTTTEPRDRLLEAMLEERGDVRPFDVRDRVAAATAADRERATDRVAAASARPAPRWLTAAAVLLMGGGAVLALVVSGPPGGGDGRAAIEQQDPAADGWTEIRPGSVRQWRQLLRDVQAVTIAAGLLSTPQPAAAAAAAPRLRVTDPDRVAALCRALQGCNKTPFEAGWIWPNHVRLELPGKRHMSCALGRDLLDVRGLGDFQPSAELLALLRPLTERADWLARRQAGVVESVAELERDGEAGFPPGLRRLTLRNASDAMFAELERFPALVEITVESGRDNVTARGLASLAGHRGLRVLRLPHCATGDAALRHLATIPTLRELELAYAGSADDPLTGEGFAAFAAHANLAVLDLSWADDLSDDGLRAVAALPALRSLDLTARKLGSVTAAGLQALGRCRALRTLDLTLCPLDLRPALAAVGALPGLEELDLSGTKVDAAALAGLRGDGPLRSLDLRNCAAVDDQALMVVSSLRGLQTLRLRMNRSLSDAALLAIGTLGELRELELSNVPVGAGGVELLAGLDKLQRLDMGFTRIDDAGVEHLAAARSLRELELPGCNAITPAAVGSFAKMRQLRLLDLNVCRGLDAAAFSAIAAALPDTEVRVPSELR